MNDRKLDQARNGMNIEPAHYSFAMRFGRAQTDPKAGSNFLVRFAFSDQDQHLALAVGEAGYGLGPSPPAHDPV